MTEEKQDEKRFDDRQRFTTNFRIGKKYAIMLADDYMFYGEIRAISTFDVLLVFAGFLGEREYVVDYISKMDTLREWTKDDGPIPFMTIPRSKIAFSICMG